MIIEVLTYAVRKPLSCPFFSLFRSLSLLRHSFCFFFSSNTKTKRSYTHTKWNWFYLWLDPAPPFMSRRIWILFLCPFCLRLPSAPTLFTSRTMPLWFFLFYANLSPCLFQYLSFADDVSCMCTIHYFCFFLPKSIKNVVLSFFISFFRIRIWKKESKRKKHPEIPFMFVLICTCRTKH